MGGGALDSVGRKRRSRRNLVTNLAHVSYGSRSTEYHPENSHHHRQDVVGIVISTAGPLKVDAHRNQNGLPSWLDVRSTPEVKGK